MEWRWKSQHLLQEKQKSLQICNAVANLSFSATTDRTSSLLFSKVIQQLVEDFKKGPTQTNSIACCFPPLQIKQIHD